MGGHKPNLHERTQQITEWLKDHFPLPYPLRIQWVRKIPSAPGSDPTSRKTGDYALSFYLDRRCQIALSRRLINFDNLASVLIHEWAHFRSWKHGRLEDMRPEEKHDDEYWLEHGRIYRGLIDQGGLVESRLYPFRRTPRRRPA